MKKMPKVSKKG